MPCPDCVEVARLRQERAVGIEQYRNAIAAWEVEVKLLDAANARAARKSTDKEGK